MTFAYISAFSGVRYVFMGEVTGIRNGDSFMVDVCRVFRTSFGIKLPKGAEIVY